MLDLQKRESPRSVRSNILSSWVLSRFCNAHIICSFFRSGSFVESISARTRPSLSLMLRCLAMKTQDSSCTLSAKWALTRILWIYILVRSTSPPPSRRHWSSSVHAKSTRNLKMPNNKLETTLLALGKRRKPRKFIMHTLPRVNLSFEVTSHSINVLYPRLALQFERIGRPWDPKPKGLSTFQTRPTLAECGMNLYRTLALLSLRPLLINLSYRQTCHHRCWVSLNTSSCNLHYGCLLICNNYLTC